MNTPVAAIDVGTNTVLLLIAREGGGGTLEVLEEIGRMPRLGTGLAARGAIDPGAAERALDALRGFALRIADHAIPPARVRAVGTACLRRASDGAEFARRVARETGIALEIIAEEEEARLGSVAIAAEGASSETLVVDVGGGSSEVACTALDLRSSAPIGAVVLTETWLATPPLRVGGWRALRAAAGEAARIFPAGVARGRPVWAIGGTAVNLACCAGGFARFDVHATEGAVVPASAAGRFAEGLAALPLIERRALPIEPERALILPAGLAALAAVLERLGADPVRVSGRGLRYGIARELLAHDRSG